MTADAALETVVDQIAELLLLRIGLRPDKTLRGRLRRAVREEVAYQDQDAAAYSVRLLEDQDALQRLLNRVTVQETAFFRHPEQFDVLISEVLPGLLPPVKIWSAACANGQEAFTLAIVLEEQGIQGSVIATDISTKALDRTREARYTSRELSGLSPERLARHFTRHGDTWEVNAPVRDRVQTLRHNLLDPVPPDIRSCDVVLCRNVLIYLSPEQVRLFLDRVADTFSPTATLFVGAAETIWQVSDRFRAIHVGDTFIYRRRDVAPASPAQPSRAGRPSGAGTDAARTRAGAVTTRRTRSRGPAPAPSLDAGLEPTSTVGAGGGLTVEPQGAEPAQALEKVAQDAIAVGDHEAAVVAFRKCAYLRPHDPVAQLQLGLALEASGDHGSAQRAFAAARRALAEAGPDPSSTGLEGYAPSELLRLLESKL